MKKFIAALMAIIMLFSLGVLGAGAVDEPSKEPPAVMDQRPERLKDSALEAIEAQEQIDPEERITAIIVLEEQSSVFKRSPAQLQSSVQREISRQVLDGQVLEVVDSYTHVVNGFAAVVPYGKLEEIRQLPGVAAAYAAPVFKVAPDMQSNTTVLGGMDNSSGYNGEGMVIAVLDTGIEVSHKSFAAAPESPALDQDAVAGVLASRDLKAEEKKPGITASQVYRSAKVPFAFDYADNDTDVTPGSAGDHGVHVSGIAAANDGVVADVVGVAPESQILAMKVFSSSGSNGATWDDILAAADDAVALGADVINMSLGSACGFSTPEGDEGVAQVFQNIVDAGVMLSVSAGNEYSAALGTRIGKGHALTANPDYGTVGSPSTYAASMSVASVEKEEVIDSYYLTSGERTVAFNDTVEDKTAQGVDENSKSFRSLAGRDLEYVVVPGMGETKDYEGLEVSGKIALVSRGSVEYNVKKEAAKAAGAVGIVVYNNEPGMLYMQLDKFDLPSAFISQADGKFLAAQAEADRKLTVAADSGKVDNPTSGEMSDFSSWGVTPELNLKPDITAPGGNIKSTTVNNGYTTKSGTSMAAPFVSGAMAVVKQYVERKGLADSETAKAALVNTLLMNTAELVMADNNVAYSPRKQGAGSVDVNAAVKTGAYITVPGQSLPKIELGDDAAKSGSYSMSFDIHNFMDEAETFTLGGYVQTDAQEVTKQYQGKDVHQVTELPYRLEAGIPTQTVTVSAGETVTVTVSVSLTEADRDYLNTNFENGSFVEGFLILTPASSTGVTLSVPFMGFYGDWTRASIIDRGFYWDDLNGGENWAQAYTNTVGVNSLEGTLSTYLGDNPYHDDIEYLADRNAISPNGDDYMDALSFIYTGLLRNVLALEYKITDADTGEVYYEKTVDYEVKSAYSSSYYQIIPSGVEDYSKIDPWYGTDKGGLKLENDTEAIVTITGTLAYGKHVTNNEKDSWSFPITIDTEEPEAKDITVRTENGKYFVDLTVSDNQYVANVAVSDSTESKQLASFPVSEDTAGASTQCSYDITGFGENLKLIVNDYACNRNVYSIKAEGNPDDSEIIVPTKTVFTEDFEESTFPANGWTLQSAADKTWYQGSEYGSKMAMCDLSKTQQQNEWLISPTVDLSAEETEAGVIFDFYTNYYWSVKNHAHNLKVKASADGGQSWEDLWQLWDWNPKNEFGPWEKTQAKVTIPEKFQDEEAVQFAFVYEGMDGTSLWLDNIQLYVDDPSMVHTITATAGEGGTIDPSGTVSISDGKSRTFTITPEEGHFILDVKVDGESVGTPTSYTFEKVTADHTIEAAFSDASEAELLIDEDFNDCTSGGALPEGWSGAGVSGSSQKWKPSQYPYSATAFTASLGAYRTNDWNYSGVEDDRLTTPIVDLTNRTGSLSFRICLAKGYHDDGEFYCALEGTTDGENWTQLWVSNDGNITYSMASDYQSYADVNVLIPAELQKTNAQFAFRYVKKAGSEGGACSIDNVQLLAVKAASSESVLLDENFDDCTSGGTLPEGWTQSKKNTSYTWKPYKYWSQMGAYCASDTSSYDDGWGSEYGMGQDEYLITPSLNLGGKTGTMTFQFSGVASALSETPVTGKTTVTLEASTDDGKTWTPIWNARDTADQMKTGVIASTIGTADISIEIPEAFQQDGVKFAFRYQTKVGNTGGCTVFVDNIKLIAQGGSEPTPPEESFTITASAGQGGSISPNGAVKVDKGGSQAFTITPTDGYALADVLVDGESVGQQTSYTFENVTAAHTIEASFAKMPVTLPDSIHEDFNNAESLPGGWTVDGPSARYSYETWKIGRYTALNSTNAALCTQNIMFAQEQNEKLILPQINMGDSMELTFDFGASYEELASGSMRLTVKATLDKGQTWTELWNAKDHIGAVDEENEPEDITGKGSLVIPAGYCNAEAQFAFVFESSDRRNGTVAVDNIVLGASGTPAPNMYGITVAAMEHGTVTSDKTVAAPGDTITLTVKPEEGYHLKEGTLMANDEAVTGSSFIMPEKAVTITALFEKDAETPTEGQYKDGVYRGTAKGRNGDVTVEVTVKDGKIETVEVISQQESSGYWEDALAIISSLLGLGNDEAVDGVDTISGATISSEAIKKAVQEALKDAAEEDSGIFASGSGTQERPYIIASIQQLLDFAESVNNGDDYQGKYIALGVNLDLADIAWTPIGRMEQGKATGFCGSFDGRGYTVSHVNCGSAGSSAEYEAVGFFGVIGESGAVKNLNVQIEKFYNSCDAGNNPVAGGGLAGFLERNAVIDHCSVTGGSQAISVNDSRKAAVGGLVGWMKSGSLIANSWTDVGLNYGALATGVEVSMGGICGEQAQNSLIANSASFGSVPGMIMTGTLRVGGLAGHTAGAVYNCYTTSLTKANVMGEYSADGFINNDATTAIGHLIGSSSAGAALYQCYYDKNADQFSNVDLAGDPSEGKTERRQAAGWDNGTEVKTDESFIFGKSGSELVTAAFASAMNEGRKNAVKTAASDYFKSKNLLSGSISILEDKLEDGFRGWTLTDGRVLFGDEAIVTQEIAEVALLEARTVACGTAQGDIGLPATVQAELKDGSKKDFGVTWSCAGYNADQAGDYTFVGTLTLTDGITNPQGLKAYLVVKVQAGTVETAAITGVAAQAARTVAYGTTQDKLGLPGTVEVTLDNGGKKTLDVTWACTDYNAEKARDYTFEGTLTLVDGVTNPLGLKAAIRVTVEAKESTTGGGGGSISPVSYPVSVTGTENGSVKASVDSAAKGKTVTLTVRPDSGCVLDYLLVTDKDGARVNVSGQNGVYTFEMPASEVTVSAGFAKTGEPLPGLPFVDVSAGSYYAQAVRWAVGKGVTSGMTETSFAPDMNSTRAQTVTFLWRAAGSPTPKSTKNPFRDVPVNAYYYNAVMWAVQNGITEGVSADSFSPDSICTRAQVVTFLWRSVGKKEVQTANPFTDVVADAYYVNAVKWAVDQRITSGLSASSFGPNVDCTRGQIVTFLYRCMGD